MLHMLEIFRDFLSVRRITRNRPVQSRAPEVFSQPAALRAMRVDNAPLLSHLAPLYCLAGAGAHISQYYTLAVWVGGCTPDQTHYQPTLATNYIETLGFHRTQLSLESYT